MVLVHVQKEVVETCIPMCSNAKLELLCVTQFS